MEENKLTKSHKMILTNRKSGSFTGVLDVISFDISEILLETEQGMLNVKGKDLHVNRLNLEKGEVDIEGIVDSLSYSQVPASIKKPENLFGKWFK
ncbi:MAG: sporulation protein YabP [Agathobacter sp.]|nr:sporulation protein YabP [Agathobacter sp.]